MTTLLLVTGSFILELSVSVGVYVVGGKNN